MIVQSKKKAGVPAEVPLANITIETSQAHMDLESDMASNMTCMTIQVDLEQIVEENYENQGEGLKVVFEDQ